jgi:hypothetical protein
METQRLEKRYDFVAELLKESAKGHPEALIGLCDWLIIDHYYTLERLIAIASRRFKIEKRFLIRTAMNLNIEGA